MQARKKKEEEEKEREEEEEKRRIVENHSRMLQVGSRTQYKNEPRILGSYSFIHGLTFARCRGGCFNGGCMACAYRRYITTTQSAFITADCVIVKDVKLINF